MLKTKKCCTCCQDLPIENFHRNCSTKDGLHRNCKGCKSEQSRREREKHKDRIAKNNKAYCENNKEKLKEKCRNYYKNNKEIIQQKTIAYKKSNPDKVKKYSKISRQRIRIDVLSHYCDGEIKCKVCGEKEIKLLNIDHINGGGNKHKQKVRCLYSWIKRNNYPDGFQVLCWNCNYKKRMQEMRSENPTPRQLKQRNYIRGIKEEVLEHYGKTCPCGVDDIDILTLDHVNDDGAAHRKIVGEGSDFYRWLRKNNFPNDPPLQVLCMKCQYRKINDLI